MDPYVGEIRVFGGNFAPLGWALCDGRLLSISEYEALFQLIGTTYGGDGQSTFALPDLRGRSPVHQGPGFTIGHQAGVETVSLTTAEMPAHAHTWLATPADASSSDPAGNLLGATSTPAYGASNPGKDVALAPQTIGSSGGSEPHENLQPFLCLTFIIALEGIFPQPG